MSEKGLVKVNPKSIPSAVADKFGGMQVYPIVDAMEELMTTVSEAQLKRLMEQHQIIGSLSVQHDALKKEKMGMQNKVNNLPEVMRLKAMKKDLKKVEKAIETGVDMLSGSFVTLLADYMPGRPLQEKLQSIEAAMLERTQVKQLKK
jgi:hypothetical protein